MELITEPDLTEEARADALRALSSFEDAPVLHALGVARRLHQRGGLPYQTLAETVSALLHTAVQEGDLNIAIGLLQEMANDAEVLIGDDHIIIGDFELPIQE